MLEELAVEVAGEGAFEAGRGGGEGALEELAVEVAGRGRARGEAERPGKPPVDRLDRWSRR